jgi:hypothetical protein
MQTAVNYLHSSAPLIAEAASPSPHVPHPPMAPSPMIADPAPAAPMQLAETPVLWAPSPVSSFPPVPMQLSEAPAPWAAPMQLSEAPALTTATMNSEVATLSPPSSIAPALIQLANTPDQLANTPAPMQIADTPEPWASAMLRQSKPKPKVHSRSGLRSKVPTSLRQNRLPVAATDAPAPAPSTSLHWTPVPVALTYSPVLVQIVHTSATIQRTNSPAPVESTGALALPPSGYTPALEPMENALMPALTAAEPVAASSRAEHPSRCDEPTLLIAGAAFPCDAALSANTPAPTAAAPSVECSTPDTLSTSTSIENTTEPIVAESSAPSTDNDAGDFAAVPTAIALAAEPTASIAEPTASIAEPTVVIPSAEPSTSIAEPSETELVAAPAASIGSTTGGEPTAPQGVAEQAGSTEQVSFRFLTPCKRTYEETIEGFSEHLGADEGEGETQASAKVHRK